MTGTCCVLAASLLQQQGQLDLAARWYENVIEFDPDDPTVKVAPFGRWMRRDEASQRRLPSRENSMQPILAALLFLMPLAELAGQCPNTEKSLLGAWKRKSEFGFFEEMSFEIDENKKVFNSWLHHRPEIL